MVALLSEHAPRPHDTQRKQVRQEIDAPAWGV
jgi:hypothetical protein